MLVLSFFLSKKNIFLESTFYKIEYVDGERLVFSYNFEKNCNWMLEKDQCGFNIFFDFFL